MDYNTYSCCPFGLLYNFWISPTGYFPLHRSPRTLLDLCTWRSMPAMFIKHATPCSTSNSSRYLPLTWLFYFVEPTILVPNEWSKVRFSNNQLRNCYKAFSRFFYQCVNTGGNWAPATLQCQCEAYFDYNNQR